MTIAAEFLTPHADRQGFVRLGALPGVGDTFLAKRETWRVLRRVFPERKDDDPLPTDVVLLVELVPEEPVLRPPSQPPQPPPERWAYIAGVAHGALQLLRDDCARQLAVLRSLPETSDLSRWQRVGATQTCEGILRSVEPSLKQIEALIVAKPPE